MRILTIRLIILILFSTNISLANIIESNNTGGGIWTTGSSWVGGSSPTNGDTVVILAGDVITIDNNLSFNGVIQVYGTIRFDGGKINMDASSTIQLAEGSDIVSVGGGNSDQIRIGGSSNKISGDVINGLQSPNQLTEGSIAGGGGCAETGTCEENPLPVEVVSFTAKTEQNIIRLSWTTSMEENFDYFSIERSSSGYEFQEVGRIYSRTDYSSTLKEYQYTDERPLQGISYYRLKATDFDGFTEYHGIVSVKMEEVVKKLSVYPNPSNGTGVDINYSGSGNTKYKILNFSGQVIERGELFTGLNSVRFTQPLPPGIYFVYMEGDVMAKPVKMIIK